MTWLVTGGAGYIGAHVVAAMRDAGEMVVVLDDLSRPGVAGNLRWLQTVHGARIRVEVGDVRDGRLVHEAVAGVDRVFHLAA